jgi:hypothetical protein
MLAWCVRNVRAFADGASKRAIARQNTELDKARGAVDHWAAIVAGAVPGAKKHVRASAYLERAEARVRRARDWLRKIGQRNGSEGTRWRWRFLTLTHWYDPSDREAFTPAAIRSRVLGLLRQWGAIWSTRISIGGMAAATAKIEISDRGHVHLHALYWGPWIAQTYVERVQSESVPKAGHTWVQEATSKSDDLDPEAEGEAGEYAALEICKYTAKMISPLSRDWIAGEKRAVLHPAIAAAWQVATAGIQLFRHYGVMRAVVAAYKRPADDLAWRCCPECGHDLGIPGLWTRGWTDAVAREARSRWRVALEVRAE